MSRNPSFARATACLLALAFALPATALARQQIGSFVSGERAMYIELSPLEAGADYTLEVRSVPPGSSDVFVIASTE